jgi:hypothetical protein
LGQIFIQGVGYVDDGMGDEQQPTPPQQSPYAYNYTYNQPSPQPTYNNPPSVADFYEQESQTYQPPPPPPALPQYQPQDPFLLPTVSDFYEQESQTYQPPIPKANPWDFNSSDWYTPAPQPDYFDYYSQELTAQPQPPAPDPFKSDGSVSNMWEQESYLPPTLDAYGKPLSPIGKAYYDQWNQTSGSGADWGGPDFSPVFNQAANTLNTLADNQGSPAAFYEQESQTPPPEAWMQVAQGAKRFAEQHPGTSSPFDTLGDAAQGILTGLGAVISPIGMGVDATANSGIPGLSQAAQALRFGWEQGVEPAGNLGLSTIGALSQGGDVLDLLHGAGPFGMVVGGAADILQGRDPTQYYKDVAPELPLTRLLSQADYSTTDAWQAWRSRQVQQEYDNQIAAGKTPEEAQRAAVRLGEKLLNPLNAAEYPGMQDFSRLPALAQLATMFTEPVANRVYGGAVRPFTQGLPAVIGQAAEATGVSRLVDQGLNATVRPGSQKAFKFGQEADRVASTLEKEAGKLDLTAQDVLPDFLQNPASPLYYEKIIKGVAKDPIKQEVVDRVNQIYNASPLTDLSKPDTAITGGKVGIGESEFGQQMQDTGQRPAPAVPVTPIDPSTFPTNNGVPSGWKLHLAVDPANAGAVDTVLQDLKAKGEFNGYKQGSNSGQDGKDFTIYAGSKAQAQAVSDALSQRVGGLLDNPRGDTLVDDIPFGSKVMGRFDAYDPEFHQYGSGGIPYTKDDMAQKVWGGVTSDQARANADAILRLKYGEYYTGEAASKSATPVDPATVAQNAASDAAFNDITANRPPAVEPTTLPDRYKPIKLPNRDTAEMGEFFSAAKTAQAIDVKALKLDNTVGSPRLRPALPLEEWGKLGSLIRGANRYTTQPLSRLFLNTASRAVRDPASNYLKLLVERPDAIGRWVTDKLNGDKTNSVASQYNRITGGAMEELGPASMTADIMGGSGGQGGKTNGVANLAYFVANPLNEGAAHLVRKATGGKFQDWSTFVERNEKATKTVLYQHTFLDEYYRNVSEGPTTEFFQENPQLLEAVNSGKMSLEQLHRAIQAKTFDGFDMDDLANNRYNPANVSDGYAKEADGVLSGTAGTYGKILKEGIGSLAERVKEENDVRVLNYLKDTGTRIPDLDLSRVNPKVLANAKANANLIKLEEIDSNHLIAQQMVSEALDAMDATRITLFPKDNAVYDAAHFLINSAINYAADSKRFDLFSTTFKDAQTAREVFYSGKYKAPPTDFSRMMALKDKYESGARMAPQQVREYETWRDSQPIRNMASEAGVELPDPDLNASLFKDANSLEDIQGVLRQTENFKSREYDEFGGTPLTVAHQKQLAQVIFDKDAVAFNRLLSDVQKDPRYIEGITGEDRGKKTGVYVDKTGANADRTVNRLQAYWNDANAADTPSPGLPPRTTPGPKADYTDLYDRVNKPPAARFQVDRPRGGKSMGSVLTPTAMRQMAAKFNRTETLTSKGDVYNKGTDRAQLNRWFQDFMATDQYYRQISNNTFKLDPDTLSPVRISDGVSLDELMGKPAPERIGPEIPPLPTEAEGISVPDLMDAIKARYGDDAVKNFNEMDPAQADIIQQEISRSILGIDPLNPLTNPKGSAEHAKAVEMLQKFLDDMDARKADYESRVETGEALKDQYNLDMKTVTQSLLAERFQAAYKAKEAAYNKTKGSFFDYRDKNRIDQVLGTVLPFQYWARQNFAYLARHFAANPYHFAAVLNFYQQLEKENSSDPTIPGYSKYDIYIAKLPGGENFMWDFGSLFPYNPLGQNNTFGGLAIMTDDDLANANVANKEPLSIFEVAFGKDVVKNGKVVGRSKGIAPSFLRPNPAIEDFLQTGIVNKWFTNLGWAGPGQSTLGQDYPEETRGQHARLGLIPAASDYRSIGAMTGITKAMRDAGLIKGDLDIEAPFNEVAYGKNAGKPQTAIYQELARMTANKEITEEEAKKAIIAYKDGSYGSVALLAALDRVEADDAPRRILSKIGFSGQLSNTPRQQEANKLYAGMNEAYGGDKAGYTVDANGNKVYKPSEISQYFKDNPAASVLTSTQASDTPETIKQGLADNKTREALNQLYADQKADKIDSRTFGIEKEKLKAANPAYFEKYPDKTSADQQKYFELLDDYKKAGGDRFDEMQKEAYGLKAAGDDAGFKKIVTLPEYITGQEKRNNFLIDHPDFLEQHNKFGQISNINRNAEGVGGLARTNPQLAPKAPRTMEDIKYAQTESKYYAVGGDDYDRMQTKIQEYFDHAQDSKAYDIINSRDYKRIGAALDQFKIDNPDFTTRYNQEYTAKYGKPPKSDVEKQYDEQRAAYYQIGGPQFDQTQKKIDELFKAGKDAEAYTLMNDRDYKRVTAAQDQFKYDNPDFARRYNTDNFAKYGTTPKSDADKLFSEQKGQYANIGGATYDAMSKMVSDYMDAGDKKSAGVILGSAAYKQAKAARDQFLADNPDFAARYKAENEAKYGPAKPASNSGGTGSSSGGGTRSTSTYRASYSAPRRYAPAKTTRKATTAKKTTYTTQNRSNTTARTNTKNKTVTSPSAPYTPAQKTAYAKALKAKPGNIAYAQAAARNALNTPAPPTATRSSTPAINQKDPWYLPPTKTTQPAAVSRPAASTATSSGQNEWTPAQKQKYAQLRAAGKSTAYAAKAANNMVAGSQGVRPNSQGSIDTPNNIIYSVSQNSNATTNSAPVYRPQTPYMIPIHIGGSSHRGTTPKPPKPVKSKLRLPTLGRPKIYDSRLGY